MANGMCNVIIKSYCLNIDFFADMVFLFIFHQNLSIRLTLPVVNTHIFCRDMWTFSVLVKMPDTNVSQIINCKQADYLLWLFTHLDSC